MTKTKAEQIHFTTPVAYMPLNSEKHPGLVVCLLPDLIEAQKKHQEEIAATRRETVERVRKILRERLKELREENTDFDYTNGFREALDIFDLGLD